MSGLNNIEMKTSSLFLNPMHHGDQDEWGAENLLQCIPTPNPDFGFPEYMSIEDLVNFYLPDCDPLLGELYQTSLPTRGPTSSFSTRCGIHSQSQPMNPCHHSGRVVTADGDQHYYLRPEKHHGQSLPMPITDENVESSSRVQVANLIEETFSLQQQPQSKSNLTAVQTQTMNRETYCFYDEKSLDEPFKPFQDRNSKREYGQQTQLKTQQQSTLQLSCRKHESLPLLPPQNYQEVLNIPGEWLRPCDYHTRLQLQKQRFVKEKKKFRLLQKELRLKKAGQSSLQKSRQTQSLK